MKKAFKILGIIFLILFLVVGIINWWVVTNKIPQRLALMDEDVRVENFRHMDDLFPYRTIKKPRYPTDLISDPQPMNPEYEWDDTISDLDTFLERTFTTGFIVVQNDKIIYEHYGLEADETSKLTSWSVAKSVQSALIGIAIDEGLIDSIHDPVTKYLPQLQGSGYDGVSIKALLQMSSGVQFNEDYDDLFSDISIMFAKGFILGTGIRNYPEGLESERAPGEAFHYISVDSQVLTMVLDSVVEDSVSHYMEEKIWRPLGMESDAFWTVDTEKDTAIEYGFCCLNATLRDYARFGLLYLNKGKWEGRRIVPQAWVEESLTPDAEYLLLQGLYGPDWDIGYQYQWWIPAGDDEEFLAIGVWGQYIYGNPKQNIVIVKTSVDPNFDNNDLETLAVFRAVVDALK